MTLIKLFLITGLAFTLAVSCSADKTKEARDNGGEGGEGMGNKPNKPTNPVKIVEKIDPALRFQKPTQIESEFLNTMDLDFGDADRAYFSFVHDAKEDGSFFFTLAQVRLHLKECKTPAEDHRFVMEVFWQRAEGTNQRFLDKQFSPSIDEFQFRKGQRYYLTYSIRDLKQVADCKGATLKFATFLKNY